MALEVFSSIRYLIKAEDISIDNWIFKLHYRFTVLVLLASAAIGVAKQHFGDPINCQTANGVSSKVMDDYCWIHSTFHVRSEYQGNVGCVLDTVLTREDTILSAAAETPDTAFYQWVPFTLLFQALLFYFPRKIWKSFEGGLMETFGKDAKRAILLAEETQSDIESAFYKEAVAKKYACLFQSTLHHNNGYFLQFFFCEVLNFMADVFNIYLTDVFLGGRFFRYGPQVLKYYKHSHSLRRELPNPMCTVFPTVTSCTFHSVGTAAGEQKFNSLCVLSLNIINEKIYIFLWFWFTFVTTITAIHLVYRVFIILLPYSRSMMLIVRARTYRSSDVKTVHRVLSRCYLGDWWVLYQLGRNSNTHFFRFLLRHIEKQMFNTNGEVGTRTLKKPPLPGSLRRSPPRLSHLRTLVPDELNGHSIEEDSEEEDIATVEGHQQHTMRKRQKGKKISMPYTV